MTGAQANMFEASLEEAAMKHFEGLFTALLADPSPQAFTHFETELERLVDVSSKVDELIHSKYGRMAS